MKSCMGSTAELACSQGCSHNPSGLHAVTGGSCCVLQVHILTNSDCESQVQELLGGPPTVSSSSNLSGKFTALCKIITLLFCCYHSNCMRNQLFIKQQILTKMCSYHDHIVLHNRLCIFRYPLPVDVLAKLQLRHC